MKRLLTLLCLLAGHLCSAQHELIFSLEVNDTLYRQHIFIDSTDTSNIWQIGRPQKTLFDTAYSGTNALVTDTLNPYPSYDTSSFTIELPKAICPAYAQGRCGTLDVLSLSQKLDINLDDSLSIEVFEDGDTVWRNVTKTFNSMPAASGWQSSFSSYIYSYSGGIPDTSNIRVRFTFRSGNNATAKEGWMIDNIVAHYWWSDGIKDVQKKGIYVYPNPNKGNFTFSTPTSNGIITLYDIKGTKVYDIDIKQSETKFDLNLPGGIYILKYQTDTELLTEKLIIR